MRVGDKVRYNIVMEDDGETLRNYTQYEMDYTNQLDIITAKVKNTFLGVTDIFSNDFIYLQDIMVECVWKTVCFLVQE